MYARDIDHLVTFNKNGLWIKEKSLQNGGRIISAENIKDAEIFDVTIFEFDEEFILKKKNLSQKKADIKTNNWILNDVNYL